MSDSGKKPSAISLGDARKLLERKLKDQEKAKIVAMAADKTMTQKDAAGTLGLQERQVRNLVQRYKEGGAEALAHRGRGMPSNHRLPDEVRSNALGIIGSRLLHCGPTLVADELSELYGIHLNPETARRWMIERGIWDPTEARVKPRRWRERKPGFGQLVQMDTSHHPFFGPEHGKEYCIAMIDDATSRLDARFYPADSTETNMDLLRRHIIVHGRPMALYVDRASHFKVNASNLPKTGPDGAGTPPMTQIRESMRQLNIRVIFARSPQAKGRVELVFDTIQDRGVNMMVTRGIADIESANAFLPWFNSKCTRPPMRDIDCHRTAEGYDLAAILCPKVERTVRRDYTFQNDNVKYQIEAGDTTPRMFRKRVVLELRLDGTIKCMFDGKYVHFLPGRKPKM
jgi:transposase